MMTPDLLTLNDMPGAYPPSFYAAQGTLDPLPRAEGERHCDVCVVGGGFTGLSTAMHLARRGYSVTVLEAQRVGFGASGRNGGQVGLGHHMAQEELEKLIGTGPARALWDLAEAAVALVRELCETPEVRTRFHNGIVGAVHRKRYEAGSRAYVRHLRDEYGCDIRYLERDEMRDVIRSDFYESGYLYARGGHVDPLQLVLGLARLAMAAGAEVFERSRVVSITEGPKVVLTTDSGATVRASHVVLACNGYLGNLNAKVAARVMPVNSYIIATEPMTDDQRAAVMSRNVAVYDSKFALNYYRFSDDNRLLFGNAQGYRYKFHSNIPARSRRALEEVFPQLHGIGIDYGWGGTLAMTMNHMPHFEWLADNIISMSGYSGHGVALGTYSGKIAADAIAGQAEAFDLMRSVPTPRFPGGAMMRAPLLFLAMTWFALRDKL